MHGFDVGKSVSNSQNLLAGSTAVLLETLFQDRSHAKHWFKHFNTLVLTALQYVKWNHPIFVSYIPNIHRTSEISNAYLSRILRNPYSKWDLWTSVGKKSCIRKFKTENNLNLIMKQMKKVSRVSREPTRLILSWINHMELFQPPHTTLYATAPLYTMNQ